MLGTDPRLPLALAALLVCAGPPVAAQEFPGPPSVEAYTRSFVSAVRAMDVDAWADLVADDVVMMDPTGRILEGRDAFHDLWSRSFEGRSGPNPLEVRVAETRVGDGLAVVRAAYGPEGGPDVGRYVWVLERDGGGEWRLAWWIFTRSPGG